MIETFMMCDSKNVIYLASCKKCNLQYIGSSTTDFRVRFCNHKSAMVTKKKNRTPHDLNIFFFQSRSNADNCKQFK